MKDVMIDLETMGQGPAAAIISIGAVEFDRETRQIGTSVHIRVDLRSSVQLGGMMDPDTVLWSSPCSSRAVATCATCGSGATAPTSTT